MRGVIVHDEMDIEIAYADHLPRTDTGKLRLVVSEVEGASIRASTARSPKSSSNA